jgi:LPXTG-site transpeptidase (sortase) family protein
MAAVLGLVGLTLVTAGLRSTNDAAANEQAQLERVLPEPQPRPAPTPKPTTVRAAPHVWAQMPRPQRLTIPAIGVSAPIISLGRLADGSMQTPDNVTDTGWFAPGPEPGEKGAAVIAGHVDSYKGPGVFYHLRALQRGDVITITLADRRALHFVVTGTKQAAKNKFPAKLVFAKTDRPTLRLITCGGAFNSSTGHYVDNYIVFARLLGQP